MQKRRRVPSICVFAGKQGRVRGCLRLDTIETGVYRHSVSLMEQRRARDKNGSYRPGGRIYIITESRTTVKNWSSSGFHQMIPACLPAYLKYLYLLRTYLLYGALHILRLPRDESGR